MKKLFMIVIPLVIAIALSGCFGFMGGYDFSYMSSDEYSSGNTQIEDGTNLTKIHLQWYAGNVTIKTHEEKSVLIEETATGVSDDDHRVHYWYSTLKDSLEDVLFIHFGKSGVKDYDGMQKDITVTLPANDHYYIGITSDSANVNVDLDDYENMLDELTITSNTGSISANISSADVVQIAGYSDDKGSADNRLYSLNATGRIYSLGMNSSYAKIVINAKEVGTMGTVGSVFNETHFTAQKAKVIKLSCTKGVSYITVNEFSSMDLEMREKPVYITLPADTEFTLNKTKDKVFDGEEDKVSDVIEIDFENVSKVSDTKYTVGSGEKKINIITYNAIYIRSTQ